MGGGAWSFLVGGVICLVNSVNERDLRLLNSRSGFLTCEALVGGEGLGSCLGGCGSMILRVRLLRGTAHGKWEEVGGNNRSVMPLDVLGCTRATLTSSTSYLDRKVRGILEEWS